MINVTAPINTPQITLMKIGASGFSGVMPLEDMALIADILESAAVTYDIKIKTRANMLI